MVNGSNPGFSILTLKNKETSYEIENIEMHHFQMYNYLIYKAKVWTLFSFVSEQTVSFFPKIDVESIRGFYREKMAKNPAIFAHYEAVTTCG